MAPSGFTEEVTRVLTPRRGGRAGAAGAAGLAQATQVRRRPPDLPGAPVEPDERPGRPRSVWPWVLVIVLILALAGAAYVILTNWNTGTAEMRTVPPVVGLSEAAAKAKIETAGFKAEKEGTQPSADVAAGNVARQDPEQNTKLEKGKTIGYWLSSGEGKVEVPNVVGRQPSGSRGQAHQGRAGSGAPSLRSTRTRKWGRCCGRTRKPTKKVDAGTTVTITVAAATNTVKVPPSNGHARRRMPSPCSTA